MKAKVTRDAAELLAEWGDAYRQVNIAEPPETRVERRWPHVGGRRYSRMTARLLARAKEVS